MTDHELLASFVDSNSSEAFAELVNRHMSYVLGVCRRVLGDEALAEDATQTTFLFLAQKARQIPPQTVLAGWLYLTAQHSALTIRRTEMRRQKREQEVSMMRTRAAEDDSRRAEEHWGDIRQHVDNLLTTLPSLQREAILLRFFYGLSQADAAKEAGCPVETMHWRATKGIEKLRTALKRQGVAISSGSLAMALAMPATEALPAHLAAQVNSLAAGTSSASALVTNTVSALRVSASSGTSALSRKITVYGMAALFAVATGVAVVHYSSTANKASKGRVIFEENFIGGNASRWTFTNATTKAETLNAESGTIWGLQLSAVDPKAPAEAHANLPELPSAIAVEATIFAPEPASGAGNSVVIGVDSTDVSGGPPTQELVKPQYVQRAAPEAGGWRHLRIELRQLAEPRSPRLRITSFNDNTLIDDRIISATLGRKIKLSATSLKPFFTAIRVLELNTEPNPH